MTRSEDGAAVVTAIGITALLVTVALICGGAVALVATHRQRLTWRLSQALRRRRSGTSRVLQLPASPLGTEGQ